MIENEQNKYEQALSLYNTSLNDEAISAKVEQIIRDKVAENNTPEVKKFLLGCVELTSLKTTDSEESILRLTECVNQFDEDYPAPCSHHLRLSMLRRHRKPKPGGRRC